MQYENSRLLSHTFTSMLWGADIGFFCGLALARRNLRKSFGLACRYAVLGMGIGAGYAFQESQRRFKELKF